MNEKKPSFFRELSGKVLVSLITHVLLASGLLLMTWVGTLRAGELFSFSPLQQTLLTVSAVLLVLGAAGYFFYRRYSKHVPRFDRPAFDFYVLEKEFTHEYLDPLCIRHTRRWVVKALRNGLDAFPDKYCWSGERAEMQATIEGHRVIKSGFRNVFTLYQYQFGRALKKGSTVEIEVQFMLYGTHKYFISTPIEEPTDTLFMTIIFPPHWGVRKVMLDIAPISGSKKNARPEEEAEVVRGRYKWVVQKPKLMHHYEMKWHLNHPTNETDSTAQ